MKDIKDNKYFKIGLGIYLALLFLGETGGHFISLGCLYISVFLLAKYIHEEYDVGSLTIGMIAVGVSFLLHLSGVSSKIGSVGSILGKSIQTWTALGALFLFALFLYMAFVKENFDVEKEIKNFINSED